MSSCSSEARRCQPLLGTFVEIAAVAASELQANDAIGLAFDAIRRVQSLMSFHEPESDVSRLNRDAGRRPVPVDPWTLKVLEAAERFHRLSAGAFDIAVAPLLQRWGFLPPAGNSRRMSPANRLPETIQILPSGRVRFHTPIQIDLGGIAKGFAVDRATEALKAAGATAGRVNAGGDLRVFGRSAATIHLRHPGAPGLVLPLCRLADAALASSAIYFSRKRHRGRWVSPLVDPRCNRPSMKTASVSVQAPTCLEADVLTKVVTLLGRRSAPILRECAAAAFILTRDGRLTASGASHETQ